MSEAVRPSRKQAGSESVKPPSGKQRLLEAAEKLFAEAGFLGVSAAQIAKEAGVAHGLLFHHFGSMEELYGEVSRVAADRMDAVQLQSFRGRTGREQISSFLRAHMRAVKQRQGDAIFRARALDAAVGSTVSEIWEASRQRAIAKLCEVLGVAAPTRKVQLCLRAWIGFHDQLVLGWLRERALTETEVLQWTLGQLDSLATRVLQVDLDREL
ncbi:TetR/AcrR family transcriptional regulator [Ramlibacter terrae]|uniref:TetR/AcrR family transcriptional regulator n=1 Tax=Ramlibacter terrae TaxID=2732511 RepID=A0ABX6P5K6_9BURK|nr:TetR/AcrR family transcriptional regulator [Ramlibacter terrae]